jgi:lipopolysaccharide export system permease protein
MKTLIPPLYFRYIAKHYIKNLLSVLLGLAFAFAAIDYFQNAQQLDVSWNYKILYIFYKWEQALGLLYPLALVFALIMTKLSFVKNGTMGVLHAFGFGKYRLLLPIFLVATLVYLLFFFLNMTGFAYAKDKADSLLRNEMGVYDVNDVFFKYNDTFVYMKKLDPIHKRMSDITIFKVTENRVSYVMHAQSAVFDGELWYAKRVRVKYHIYDEKGNLLRYEERFMPRFKTLEGYKPKIIESLYEGKTMNIRDALGTWALLRSQGLNTDKIRASFYEKTVTPLFSLAMLIILFVKIPYHRRMMHWGKTVAYAIGATFVVWGVLFGLNQIGRNGVVLPELAIVLPVALLWVGAFYLYFKPDKVR